jgi:hypothetical protein
MNLIHSNPLLTRTKRRGAYVNKLSEMARGVDGTNARSQKRSRVRPRAAQPRALYSVVKRWKTRTLCNFQKKKVGVRKLRILGCLCPWLSAAAAEWRERVGCWLQRHRPHHAPRSQWRCLTRNRCCNTTVTAVRASRPPRRKKARLKALVMIYPSEQTRLHLNYKAAAS